MRTETFYGIRIGDPRRHFPYLRIGYDDCVQLFTKREDALRECRRFAVTKHLKVVKVKVTYAG